jgi:broad specificity phosphatase PhoE
VEVGATGLLAARHLRVAVILASMDDCATSALRVALERALRNDQLPLLLVRHARTADNAARVLVGRRDVPLDGEGRRQARLLRAVLAPLAPTCLVVSPLLRARQTLEGLGPARVEPQLVEVHHGEIEGLQEEEFRTRYASFLARWQADPEHTAIPGGESLGQASERAYAALCEVARHTPSPGPALVCSHQLVIATLLCRCQGLPLARYRNFTCRNTAINLLGYREGRWQLHLSDHTGHLEEA